MIINQASHEHYNHNYNINSIKQFILIAVDKLIANRSSTVVSEGDWVILGCRSLLGEGLKYCSFVAPDGTGYSLSKSKESNHARYSYAGNGLENGTKFRKIFLYQHFLKFLIIFFR